MGPRKRAARGRWQYSVGEAPHLLTAFERKDKGYRIYTRLWDGKKYTQKRFLCDSIRDEKGRIVPELEIEAQRLTVLRHQRILAGLSADVTTGPLTMAGGFRLVLDRKTGKYPTDTRWRGNVERARDVILRVLESDLLWSEVRHAHYRKLWREMAREFQKDGRHGHRQAEITCGVLQSTARWLQQEEHIEPGAGDPASGWRARMKEDWEEIVGSVKAPAKPRYSPDELVKLWAALPHADPRLALGMEIGAELRLGQVPRSKRSDVGPSPCGRWTIGSVLVHGRGKKFGELVILTGDQRRHLTRALTSGYLAELERAFRAGEIKDYSLMPGGRLRGFDDRRGEKVQCVPVERANTAIGLTGLRKQWQQLEELAGVEHVDGRAWYGVRRIQADRAEDVETDARVLNRLGAWKRTSTREGYQEQGRPEIGAKAAEARKRIRPGKPKREADDGE